MCCGFLMEEMYQSGYSIFVCKKEIQICSLVMLNFRGGEPLTIVKYSKAEANDIFFFFLFYPQIARAMFGPFF